MIYDSLKHLDSYRGIHPGVLRGLELLRDTDFSQMADGRYEVDGENLFYMLQSYTSSPANDTPEAHKKYIDIQFLISGQEKIAVGPLEEMTEQVEARPEGDIWFYRGPLSEVLVSGDKFAALWPGDAHAPGIAVGEPTPCRKCVVKVKVKVKV